MTRMGLGLHDSIYCNFMTVGYTKFRPDEGFGHIRQHVCRRFDLFSMEELRKAIQKSSTTKDCVHFSLDEIYGIKAQMSTLFKPLEGNNKYFSFCLHIYSRVE